MSSCFTEHELPNGLRVLCETMPRVRSVAAAFVATTGSRDEEPHEHGVSHFLEHMCFKGTARRDCRAINVRFDELGAIYNAYTSKEHTVYYGWVPRPRLADQIELLADMMRPSLPAPDFETERHVILEEIAMSDDNFDRLVWNFVHEVVFGSHALGHEILGEKATITGLPRDTLVSYHRRRYASNHLRLVVAGAAQAEEVFAAAGRHCADWQRSPVGNGSGPAPPALATGVRKLKLDRFKQQSLILLYPAVPRGHVSEETIEAFCGLFGGHNSRCYWNIVQKGLCTNAGAAWIAYRDYGVLALYADGEPERCAEMLAALRAQASDVAEHGFTTDEVQRVKNQRRTQLALEAENPRTRIMQLIDDVETYQRPLTPDARLAAVAEVTPDSLKRYLASYPITGDGLLLSCGPRDWPA
ncbi:MAG: insulinase family protein [Phycisphaerales bacterium]|nr:insulinase family protein [Phycisphaerales bacterium]